MFELLTSEDLKLFFFNITLGKNILLIYKVFVNHKTLYYIQTVIDAVLQNININCEGQTLSKPV